MPRQHGSAEGLITSLYCSLETPLRKAVGYGAERRKSRMVTQTDVCVVWLLPSIRRKMAHAYLDYLQSSYGRAFLAKLAACGVRRDTDLRIPADELSDRKCKSCLRNVERDARRDRERAAALEKYGIEEGSRR
jgi:hypothetical protein